MKFLPHLFKLKETLFSSFVCLNICFILDCEDYYTLVPLEVSPVFPGLICALNGISKDHQPPRSLTDKCTYNNTFSLSTCYRLLLKICSL